MIEQLKRVDYFLHRRLWQSLNLEVRPGHVMLMVKLARTAKDNPQGLRVSELASSFNVSAPGVTQLVTGLEEKGYVSRSMDPEDRRAVRVSLTESGCRLAESLKTSMETTFAGLVEHLGHDKCRRLLALLADMLRYFDQRDPRGASAPGEPEGQSS
jgi:DNA-binding MarR family transcriptional regulator